MKKKRKWNIPPEDAEKMNILNELIRGMKSEDIKWMLYKVEVNPKHAFKLFVEGGVLPAVKKYLKPFASARTLPFQQPEFKIDHRDSECKFFIVDDFQKKILLVYVKTHVEHKDVDELLRNMEDFPNLVGKQYSGYSLAGGISGMTFEKGVDAYALKKGILVFMESGDFVTFREPSPLMTVRL